MLRRLATTLLLSFLVGCSRTPDRSAPIDKVDIVATVYPLAQVAQAVGGPVVKVRWLVESGQSLRGLGEAERESTQAARLVVLNSGVTEPWISGDLGMALSGERLLALNLLPSARAANPAGFLWLDPIIVREAAVELHSRLLSLRPRQQAILNDRTDAFTTELDGLVQTTREQFQPFAGQHVLTLRHDFDAFLARLNLMAEVPLDRSAADLNDSDLRYLRGVAAQSKVLLIGDDTPSATRDRLKAIGLPIVAIDPLGSSAASGRDTYLEIMRFDYDALMSGLNSK